MSASRDRVDHFAAAVRTPHAFARVTARCPSLQGSRLWYAHGRQGIFVDVRVDYADAAPVAPPPAYSARAALSERYPGVDTPSLIGSSSSDAAAGSGSRWQNAFTKQGPRMHRDDTTFQMSSRGWGPLGEVLSTFGVMDGIVSRILMQVRSTPPLLRHPRCWRDAC